MAFRILHLDEDTYLEHTSDREQAIWFTPHRNQAKVFTQLEEAESTVHSFNPMLQGIPFLAQQVGEELRTT